MDTDWKSILLAQEDAQGLCNVGMQMIAHIEEQNKEIKRLKYRLNHQTEDDVANCKAGRHKDCGAN